MLTGTITALVTPFKKSGAIDFTSIDNLLHAQMKAKINALVVLGSTAEAMMLDLTEKLAVLKYIVKKVDEFYLDYGMRPAIIVGVCATATIGAKELCQAFNKVAGVDYYMLTTPPYSRATQDGLYLHFATLAEATKRKIILYNIPGRTACDLEDITTVALAKKYNNIVGLKDATGNINRCINLLHLLAQSKLQNKFNLYCGDDALLLPFISCGGSGVISVLSNFIPEQMQQLCQALLKHELAKARTLNDKLWLLYAQLSLEPNPIVIKWLLYYCKIIKTPNVRLPLTVLTPISRTKVRKCLQDLGCAL